VQAGRGPVLRTPFSRDTEADDDGTQGESAIVLDLSEGEDPSISGIHLLLMMGVANWKDGNHEKASESLQSALAIARKSGNKTHQAMCYKALALVKSDSEENEEAIAAYRQVLELGTENVTIWNNIGALYLKTGRNEEALQAYKNALQREPNDPVGWHGLGNVYASLAKLDEAITCYRKAIQFNAGYMTPWVKLADVLKRQNRFQDALYAYLRTVEMDNKNVHAWSEIGSIYFKAGSYEQATDAYKKALDLGMDSPALRNNLADALTHTGNYLEAVPHFQKVIEHADDEAERAALWNRLGDVHRRMNEYESAVAAYEMADKLLATLADVESEAMLENFKQDVDSLDDVVASQKILLETEIGTPAAPAQEMQSRTNPANPGNVQQPSSSDFAEASRQSLVVNRDKELAESLIPNISQLNMENAQLWVRLGSTYLKAGALDRSMDAFRRAVNLDPTNGKACFYLGQVYAQKVELVEAVTYTQKSVELLQDVKEKANSLSCLGDLYRQMKEYDKALAAFEEAIGDDPENDTILLRLNQFQEDLDKISTPDNAEKSEELGSSNFDEHANSENNLRASLSGAGDPVQSDNSGLVDLDSANVWNELGNIFTRYKSYDEAISAFYKAIEKNPEFGWSYCNLALVFCRQGRSAEAVDLYQKSINLLWADADKVVVWNRLGDAYRQLGNYDSAIDAYQNADRLKAASGASSSVSAEAGLDQFLPHFIS